VKIINAMEHDDTENEVFQTPYIGQCVAPSTPGNAMKITVQNTLVRTTSVQSTPISQQTPTSSLSTSTSPDPTLASLLPRKTRSLCDIYNEDTTNSFSVFAMFSQLDYPLTFE
jgi:hypothetical protein